MEERLCLKRSKASLCFLGHLVKEAGKRVKKKTKKKIINIFELLFIVLLIYENVLGL